MGTLIFLFPEPFVQGLTAYSQAESRNRLVPSCASHSLVHEALLELFQRRQSLGESYRDTLPLHLLGQALVRRRWLLENMGFKDIHGEFA